MNQTKAERMAVLKAMKTVIDQELKDLQGEARQELLELYDKYGVTQLEVNVNEKRVGTYSVPLNKPTTRSEVVILDKQALFADKLYSMSEFIREHAQEYAEWCFETTGAAPDGCEYREYEIPASVGTPRLNGCKPEDVFQAIGNQLSAHIAGLIEGNSNA